MPRHKEVHLQKAVARYLDYSNVLWCHVANERKTSRARGGNLKMMGVKPGVPDCLIFEPKGPWMGLAIELKIKPNEVTESQAHWLNNLNLRGWCVAVCYNFDQAQQAIDEYLNL